MEDMKMVKRSALAQALWRLGCSYSQIARLMHISTRTVWAHIKADHSARRAWEKRNQSERDSALEAAKNLMQEHACYPFYLTAPEDPADWLETAKPIGTR